MIAPLLAELGSEVDSADAVSISDETLTVRRDRDGSALIQSSAAHQLQLRLADHGRVGWAGGEVRDRDQIVAAARRSLAVADPAPFFMPAPAPVPVVDTTPITPWQGPADLARLTAELASRLAGPARRVTVTAQRSAAEVEVGNTRGVSARYQTGLTGLGAAVSLDDDRAGPLALDLVQGNPIGAEEIDGLAVEFEGLLAPKVLPFRQFDTEARVWFGPRAVKGLMMAVLARHLGQAWQPGSTDYDTRLTVIDDPTARRRPGSRPIDDDGVPTRAIVLVDRGRSRAGILDLRLAARLGRPSTGHSYRRGFAGPRVGFSNIVLTAGAADPTALAAATGAGLYVPLLELGPAPNPVAGVFRVAVPWAFSLDRGDIVGRLEGIWLAGDVFELLRRVVEVGSDERWIGAARMVSLVVDGVRVNSW